MCTRHHEQAGQNAEQLVSLTKGVIFCLPLAGEVYIIHLLIAISWTYCIEVYGNAKQKFIKPLQIAVNKCLRCLQCSDRFTSVALLHNNFNLLQVTDLYKYSLSRLYHKCLYSPTTIPDTTKNILCLNNNHHNYNTCSSVNKICYRSTNNFNYFGFIGATIWNNIPENIRTITSYHSFSNKLKQWFFIN